MRIAVSGLSGCGNTTVSAKAAKALKLTPVNYTMRSLARDLGLPFEQAMRMRKEDSKLDLLLDLKQAKLAARDGVILSSRLAIWLMPHAQLKVWLAAPLKVRAQRIAQREGKPFSQALKETTARDRNDAAQYRKIYGIDVTDLSAADLVINTAALDASHAAAVIAGAAKALNMRKPAAQSEAYNKIIAVIRRKFKRSVRR
ncbi:MAG: cytidylate kinase family protein [Candidatus Micrarchaeota archaeon]